MKTWLSIALLGCTVVQAQQTINASFPIVTSAPTPSIVQIGMSPSDNNGQNPISGNSTGGTLVVPMPNPTKAGNGLLCWLNSSEATIGDVSFSDDKSNTWALINDEIAGSHLIGWWGAAGTATGTQFITATFTNNPSDNQVVCFELTNVATSSFVDVSCKATVTSGTAPACGSMTTTLANDLVLSAMQVVSFGTKPTGSATFTAQTGANWSLQQISNMDDTVTQAEVLASAGAVNPAITVSSAVTRANVVGVAIKAASSGSSSSGLYLRSVQEQVAPGYNTAISGTSQAFQFIIIGNDPWLLWQGSASPNQGISSISDSLGNTWTGLTATNDITRGGTAGAQWWHVTSAVTTGIDTLTITFAANPAVSNGATFLQFFDVLSSSGYDSSAICGSGSTPCNTDSSNSTNPPTTVTCNSITPSTSNGLILSNFNVDFGTTSAVNQGYFEAPVEKCTGQTTGCGGAGLSTSYAYMGNGFVQDDGIGAYYNPNPSTWTPTFTMQNTQNQAVGPYYCTTIAIK